MTVEELLKPRFKVKNDYPNSPFKINEIILGENHPDIDFTEYEYLFEPLQWWEFRDAKDMPKFIKELPFMNNKKIRYFEVTEYFMDDPIFSYFEAKNNGGGNFGTGRYLPVTKAEYELNQK